MERLTEPAPRLRVALTGNVALELLALGIIGGQLGGDIRGVFFVLGQQHGNGFFG